MTSPIPSPDPALFAWLPEPMRAAGIRWRFGLREGAELRVLRIFGALWASDNGAAVCSEVPAIDERGPEAWAVKGQLLLRNREPATPEVLGADVRIGPAIISASYYGFVIELWPGAAWEAESALYPVAAYVDARPVALVAPMRTGKVVA